MRRTRKERISPHSGVRRKALEDRGRAVQLRVYVTEVGSLDTVRMTVKMCLGGRGQVWRFR